MFRRIAPIAYSPIPSPLIIMPKLPSVSELMVGALLSSVLDRSSNHNSSRHLALSPRSALPVLLPHDKYLQKDPPPPLAPMPVVPNTLPHPRSRGTSFLGPISAPSRPADYFSPNHPVQLPPPQVTPHPQHPGISQHLLHEQQPHC